MNPEPDAQDGAKPNPEVKKTAAPPVRSVWSIGEIKRKLHERRAKKKAENSTDKAARRTAVATVWIAIFTVVLAVVSAITLYEVYEGGADTAKLAQAAVDQAQALRLQEQQTENVATAGTIQAKAALEAATTASDTLNQMKTSFVVEQRPYLVQEAPMWIQQPGISAQTSVNLYLRDIGKTPAVKIETYGRLIRFRGSPRTDPKGGDVFFNFLEGAFRELDESSIKGQKEKYAPFVRHDVAPGDHYFFTLLDEGPNGSYVPFTPQEMTDIGTGAMGLFLIVKARYTDQFGGRYETEVCQFFFGRDTTVWHFCQSHNVIK